VRSDDIAHACVPLLREAGHRVLACWLGDSAVAEARRIFEDAGIPCFATPEEAVRAFDMIDTFRRNQALLLEAPEASAAPAPDLGAARAIVARALAAGAETLDEVDSKALLAAFGIPVAPGRRTEPTPQAAQAAADAIGYPVVLKILSPELSHKSDSGGVELNLRDGAAVHDAALQMLTRVHERHPHARIAGFSVQPMVQRPSAQELIVGASVDATFGPVVLFGQGGTAVEVMADRAVALPPLNRVLARELVSRTRVSRLLAGWRTRAPARLDAIEEVLVAVSRLVADLPEVQELDVNPLLADADGVLALDARVRLAPAAGAGTARFAIQPYPDELAHAARWDGREIQIRPIRPEDEPLHREFLEHIAPEDLRLRFFSSRRQLPRTEVARLVQVDYAREMALLATAPDAAGAPQVLGVVRAVCDPDNEDAEFGILLRSDLKGRGLGTLLMHEIIAWLRAHGTRRLVGWVLTENEAMRALAADCGLRPDAPASRHEPGTVRYVLDLAGSDAQAGSAA